MDEIPDHPLVLVGSTRDLMDQASEFKKDNRATMDSDNQIDKHTIDTKFFTLGKNLLLLLDKLYISLFFKTCQKVSVFQILLLQSIHLFLDFTVLRDLVGDGNSLFARRGEVFPIGMLFGQDKTKLTPMESNLNAFLLLF
jgi:hypothetical protein